VTKRCLFCLEEHKGDSDCCPVCGFSEKEKEDAALYMSPGTKLLDRYVIGRTLGVGGFGVTYMAWDIHLNQKVAIKEYLPSEFSTRIPGHTHITVFSGEKSKQFYAGMRRFIEEAKSLARFTHVPGVVKIFDTFESNLTAYIVMELLEGETLADRLKRENTIPSDEAMDIVIEILKALEAIHAGNMLHRDIAPDNIYLTKSGQPKLIDFGAARYATTTYSRSITVIIKKGYSPEEQYRSRSEQGPYTDTYAMGATLYKMITGETPPDALERRACVESGKKDPLYRLRATVVEKSENPLTNAINKLSSMFRKLSAQFCSAVARMLEKTAQVMEKVAGKDGPDEDSGKLVRWLRSASEHTRGTAEHCAPGYLLTRTQATAIMNALNIRVEDRTQDAAAFREELCAAQQVLRRASRINVADYFGLTRLRIASIVAILVCVALVGMSMAGVFTRDSGIIDIPDTMTRVPQVINMDMALAQEAFEEAELLFQVSGNEYSDIIPSDCLLRQNLSGGSVVSKNTVVELVMSVGERTETVPNVLGYPLETASAVLAEGSFAVEIIEVYSASVTKGCVISQSIPSGNDYPIAGTVALDVSLGYEPGTEPADGEVAIPELCGRSFEEALALAEETGFTIMVSDKEYNSAAAEDVILSCDPAGESRISAGESVALVTSLGKEQYKVPDVVYLTEEEATAQVEHRNFVSEITYEYSTTVAEGLVIRQSPSARTWAEPGTSISLSVSKGFPPFAMPDLSGMTEEQARQTILENDLSINIEYSKSADVPEGMVISQSVPADTDVTVGTVITVTVSTGITIVEVPSVTGKNVLEARRILEDLGFKVEINRVYNAAASGEVISQSVDAGSSQVEGSTIYLNVSRGPEPVTTTTRQTTRRTTTTAKTTKTTRTTKATTTTTTTTKGSTYAVTTTTTTTRAYTTTRPTMDG